MSAAHTPGPWALSKDGSSERKNQANCVQGADGTLIVYGQANDADARLIATAPELLSWLKWSMRYLPDDVKQSWQYEMAQAVIDKATGEAA